MSVPLKTKWLCVSVPEIMCPQKKYYDENKEKLNQHAGNDYRPEGDKEKAK